MRQIKLLPGLSPFRLSACRCLVFLFLLFTAMRASGLDPDRSIDQFFHTSWIIGEGAPSGITQIAQTTDGYLWLATQTGLVRFDGIHFERYRPLNQDLPSSTITALLATPDGGLWIGFVPHGAAFLSHGRIVTYGTNEGLPLAPIYAFGRDGDGAVWTGTTLGVRRFDGSRWQSIGQDWGLPEVSIGSFFLDHAGRFWVSNLSGLFYLPPQEKRFHQYSTHPARLAETRGGMLWMAEGNSIFGFHDIAIDQSHQPPDRLIELPANRLLVDRDNTLWVLTREDGIARIANPDSLDRKTVTPSNSVTDRYGQSQYLSDNRITDAFEDREGDIWIATRGGLDRFRTGNLVPGPFPYGSEGQDLALASGEEGSIWAGNLNQPLMRLLDGSLSMLPGTRNISCAYRDADGTLWFGEYSSLLHYANGRFETVPLPPQVNPRLKWGVQAITRDGSGGLWVSVSENGVFRYDHGGWVQWGNFPGLPSRTAVSMLTDNRGRVWFGYTVNEVAVLDGRSAHTYSAADGLDIGTVTAFGGTGNHIWVGGERGLEGFDGIRFHKLATELGGAFRGVSGIVETPEGDLWINQANSLVHVRRAEIEKWLRDFHHLLRGQAFDFRDGVPGSGSPIRPLPSALLAADGRIWISGTSGTAWIDPAHIYRNPIPPPVSIQSLVADDRDYEPDTAARLPPLPSDIEITYAALSLAIPERVRFRYQLEGYDRGWQEAGDRRSAFYTDLGPGKYRFHVIACNNDGVWNETGAAIAFTVPPAWFQTWWFRTLCALAAAFFLWILYMLRLRQLASRMQLRLRERLTERERIARELHDTLLQGIQALVLRFQAAANQIAPGHPARAMVDEALNDADQVMIEGRKRVTDLRATIEPPQALAQALTAAGEELARDKPQTSFHLEAYGTPRELHPLAYDECYWIGREALLNAFYHANARNIRVELTYGPRELRFRFVDDGRGIDPAILNQGGRPGHFGLRGMRERAEKINARLDILSSQAGTEITVRIPSAAAYRYGASR